MLSLSLLSFSVWLLACGEKEEEIDPLTVDDDGDGFSENDGDCNDANPTLTPVDGDGDIFSSECDGDCDDADVSIHPYADDLVGDGIDQEEYLRMQAIQTCSATYCGEGECSTTVMGAGCICPEGSVSRGYTDLDGEQAVTCVPEENPVSLTDGVFFFHNSPSLKIYP